MKTHCLGKNVRSFNEISAKYKNHSGHQRVLESYVHILVLEAFVGPRPTGMFACHIDGDASNNRLPNLRWDTPRNNNLDAVQHRTHHNASKDLCPRGHPLDDVQRSSDGTIIGRSCSECRRIRGRARRAEKMTCPQGHPFDGVRYKADGTVRQRYCKTCVAEQLAKSRGKWWSDRTHCAYGHPLDGVVNNPDGSFKQRTCKTCKNERAREAKRLKREEHLAATAADREREAQDRQSFGPVFAAFLREHELDQQTVCDVLGIADRSSISRWVHGSAAPRAGKREEVFEKLRKFVATQ